MSDKLRVLLTNDDGIDSPGIKALQEALKDRCDVYVLAPDSNRSAVSSHIVMNQPLSFKQYDSKTYACSGYPADCVIIALRSNLFGNVKFDAVISGINKGPNMGTDCVYSGTVAAARQAVLYGVPGIALSLKSKNDEYDYTELAAFAEKNLERLISLSIPNLIVSVNSQCDKKSCGACLTTLCIRDYRDKVEIQNKNGVLQAVFCGGKIKTMGPELNEYAAVKNGYIAVTRLYAEPVGYLDRDIKADFEL